MASLSVVFDGAINSIDIAKSNTFKYGKFLVFDAVNLPDEEGYEIGFRLAIIIPVIGKTLNKDVTLPNEIAEGSITSFAIYPIPIEYSYYDFEFYCAFNSAIEVPNFRVYVLRDETTLESIQEINQEILDKLNQFVFQETISDLAIVTNQLAQDAAILALGTGIGAALAPVTAGASLALPAAIGQALLPGSSALTALLLPGI